MPPATEPPSRPSEELLAALVEHTSDVVAVGDAEGRLVYVSPSVEALLGVRPEALVGTSGLGLVHADDRPHLEAAFASGDPTTRHAPIRAEVRLRTGAGEWRYCECAFTDATHDPRIGGTVVSVRDVTERTRAEQALAARESHWRALVANARDIVTVIDADGRFTYVSPAVERLLGWQSADLVGVAARDALHPEDSVRALDGLDQQARRAGRLEPVEYRVLATDGTWRYLEGIATDLRDDPTVRGLVVNARDITDRKRAEALLAGQSTVLELIARGESLEAILEVLASMITTHAPGARGAIAVAGDPARPPRLVVGPELSAAELELLDTTAGWSQPIVAARSGAVLGRVSLVLDGRRFPLADEQRVAELAANLAAIAIGRAAAVERLAHQARHDPLTGLPNRQVFLERLEAALTGGRAGSVAVVFLDLDHFKDVNDGLGHHVGDGVLVELAQRLEGLVRRGDTVARFGGDEFVILCSVEGSGHAQLVADRVLQEVHEPYRIDDVEVVLTASAGIAVADPEPGRPDIRADEVAEALVGEAASGLLRDADVAMYRAKERGRARVELFDDALRTGLLDRLETERALRHALDRGELELAYQPIVALEDGTVAGAEALLRWSRPGAGLMFRDQFVPTAESIGLIGPIGEWALRSACAQLASWRAASQLARRMTLSVDVSSRQLVQPGVVEAVRAALGDTGVPAEALCLEVSESVLLDDVVGALLVLDALHDLGVLIWLDGFGTGYSCLEHLKRMPVDGVKLDRVFVHGLAEPGADHAIVGAMIAMSHALGMVVVGEGVEREEQGDELLRLGCDYGQGLLFAAPQPPDAFEAQVIRAGRSETA